ncbi:MAG TPA: cytochrome C oxidase subunit IV family protein [Gemmataceae bacterium]|nr:cytochrome C oxidase subunit IV family protein [Gemmataceae bacterium]
MSEAHHSEHHEGPGFQAYMVVFLALSCFTAISFVVNLTVGRNITGLVIILGVAVVKAFLVGMYFMHLVVDWGKLYYLIFPTFILAAMFITVLMPDIVLAWHH